MRNLENFSENNFEEIFTQIIEEKLPTEEVKNFLLDLNQIGFSASAFLGAVKVLKSKCVTINSPHNAIDVCGTGGDKLDTLNISTAVAFVVAGSGIPVAKHGNKAISSKSGSADILSELGVNIMADAGEIEKSLEKNNLCFMFAPLYHPALKALAEIRKELKVPTIFNFLGPLLNPANTKYQLIGTSKKETMLPMAQTLLSQNSKRVFIVHGLDGMDEISLSQNSLLIKVEDGKISTKEEINPENFGFKKIPLDEIKGGDAKFNASKLLDLLDGKKSAYHDIVVLNSAFALLVANKVNSVLDGVKLAKEVIDSGSAKKVLDRVINK